MLYDTHAHLNLEAYKDDLSHVMQEVITQHVLVNNVGTQKRSSQRALELADGKNLFAVIGLHPGNTIFDGYDDGANIEKEFDYEFYKTLGSDPKVVGIGECGLDYFRIPENLNLEQVKEIQSAAFIEQIRLAKELDKVLVIHCRATKDSFDAYDDILQILEQEKPSKVLIHSFTADWHIAERFLAAGAYIALNGIITFDKTGVLKEVVEKCPLEKLVLETDAPFLAPPPHRGKRNLPQYVEYVARYVADIRGMSFEEVAEQTTLNAKQLFNV